MPTIEPGAHLLELQTTKEAFVGKLKQIHERLLYLQYTVGNDMSYAPMPWAMSATVEDDLVTLGVKFDDGKGTVAPMQNVIQFRMFALNDQVLKVEAFTRVSMFKPYLDRLISEIEEWWQVGKSTPFSRDIDTKPEFDTKYLSEEDHKEIELLREWLKVRNDPGMLQHKFYGLHDLSKSGWARLRKKWAGHYGIPENIVEKRTKK